MSSHYWFTLAGRELVAPAWPSFRRASRPVALRLSRRVLALAMNVVRRLCGSAPAAPAPCPCSHPPVVDVCDPQAVRRALDDTVLAVCSLPGTGPWKLDHAFADLRLALNFLSCAVAGYAAFIPVDKFPKHKASLWMCCTVYFLIVVVVEALTWFGDRHVVCFLRQQPSGFLRVESAYDAAAAEYRLSISRIPRAFGLARFFRRPDAASSARTDLAFSLSDLFSDEGHFCRTWFAARVAESLAAQGLALKTD